MMSGRYRTFSLIGHFKNKSGKCMTPTCRDQDIPGTLEHLVATCPTFSTTRERLYQMWLDNTVMFPTLHATIRDILTSKNEEVICQFVLEPLAFQPILQDFIQTGNQFAKQLSFITHTFAY